MTEEQMDPRHRVIIDLVRKLTDSGHKKEAEDLKEKAAKLETFEQLDELHRWAQDMHRFMGS